MKSVLTGLPGAFLLPRFPKPGQEPFGFSCKPRNDSGFTLLETLTALTILSIALVSLLQAQATGLRARRKKDQIGRGRILAQSLLAQRVSGGRGPPRQIQGRHGQFKWSIKVSTAGPAVASRDTKAVWRLHHVRVTVAWDRNRSIQLDTLKLARAQDKGER